jgi:hypothetical protein
MFDLQDGRGQSTTKDSARIVGIAAFLNVQTNGRHANANLDVVNQNRLFGGGRSSRRTVGKPEGIQNGILRSLRRTPSNWKIDALPEK